MVAGIAHAQRETLGDHFEPRRGGRSVEHAPGGDSDWGRVLDCEPPARLRYLWHLFFDPSEATEIEVTFTVIAGATAIRLEQRGWERLGERASGRRARTQEVWGTLSARFADACQQLARPQGAR